MTDHKSGTREELLSAQIYIGKWLRSYHPTHKHN